VEELHQEHGPDKVHCIGKIKALRAFQMLAGRTNASSIDEEFQHYVHVQHFADRPADRGELAQIHLDETDRCIWLICVRLDAPPQALAAIGAAR
jgi:hypothetical protein